MPYYHLFFLSYLKLVFLFSSIYLITFSNLLLLICINFYMFLLYSTTLPHSLILFVDSLGLSMEIMYTFSKYQFIVFILIFIYFCVYVYCYTGEDIHIVFFLMLFLSFFLSFFLAALGLRCCTGFL